MQNLLVLFGEVQNELSEFFVGIIGGTETVHGAALEFSRSIRDPSDCLRNIGGPDGLGQNGTISANRNETVHLRHVGKIMKKLVFASEQLGGAHDRSPRVGFADGLLSEVLCARPFRGVVFGNPCRGYVDEIVDLHLDAQFGNLLRDSNVDVLERVVCLPTHERKRTRLDRLPGCMCFRNEIDNNVGITNDFPHGINISGTVKHESSVPQIEHRFDISMFGLVTSVSDVCVSAVVAKLVAKMFPDESRGTKDSDSQIGVGLAATRASFVQSSFRDSRHEQVRLVVLRRRGTERAVGGTKGSSCNAGRRTGGNNRTSYCETGGGGSSQHRGGLCNESLSSFSFVLSIDESSFGNRCTGVVDSVSSCRVSDSIATLSTRAVTRRALS
mmetsp:Transcript_29830/g.63874  ORF Transcript_29830/g.63874 Transcript_29830/m.63874 type:complete len:385 (+) Transcript_29830:2295-3449(+)